MPIARFEMPDGRVARFEVPEGTTPEKAQSLMQDYLASQRSPEKQEGLGRTLLEQGLQGATFALSDEAMDLLGAAGAKGYDVLTGGKLFEGRNIGDIYDEARQESQARMQRQIEQRPAASIAANIGGALLTGGAGATTKTGQAATKAITSGGTAARIAKGAGAGALSGAAYGFGAGEGGSEQRLENAATGAAFGGATGGALPAIGAAASGVKSAVLPQIDEALKPLAQRANDLGIPLSIDQLSPTKFRRTLQKVSQEAPFAGVDDFIDAQRKAFNRALAKTIGQDADNLAPDVIERFSRDASRKFGVLTKGVNVQVGDDFATRLNTIVDDAFANSGDEVGNIVQRQAAQLLKEMPAETLKGSRVAAARSNIIKKLAGKKLNPQSKEYVKEMVDLIDNTVAPYLDDAKKATLQQARREYRNFKTIEPLLEGSTDGFINPTQLLNRVKASPYIRASRTSVGQDELVDLARIGKEFLPIPGGSDTFQKGALGYGLVSTIGGFIEPITLAFSVGGVGLNRGFQKLYNQNPKLVQKLLQQGQKSGNFKPLIRASAKQAGIKAANEDKINQNIIQRLMRDESGSMRSGAALGAGAAGAAGLTATGTPEQAEAGIFDDFDRMQQKKALDKTLNFVDTLRPTREGDILPGFRQFLPDNMKDDVFKQRPADYFDKVAFLESSNNYNAKAKTSSAYGKYQLTAPTAKRLVERYGKNIGVDHSNWKKPENQEKLVRALTRENSTKLRSKLGREPSHGELYVTHFMGLSGGLKLLNPGNQSNKAAAMFPDAAKANPSIFYDIEKKNGKITRKRPRTVYEVRKLLESKINGV